jgi:hypothetical protein
VALPFFDRLDSARVHLDAFRIDDKPEEFHLLLEELAFRRFGV